VDAPIRVERLWKRFKGPDGEVLAVRDLSLAVDAGQIFGFLGPNGAGKTTTLNVLLGFLRATKGSARIFGRPAGAIDAKRRVGYLSEVHTTYEYLTPQEALAFYGKLFGLPAKVVKERTGRLLALVGLSHAARRRVGTFSKGMRQRMGLAEALINDPDLLLLDEPTAGLDPVGRREMKDALLALRDAGKTVFLCSHLLSEVEEVCDCVGILYNGQLLRMGKLEELLTAAERIEILAEGVSREAAARLRELAGSFEDNAGIVKAILPKERAQEALRAAVSAGAEILSFNPYRESLEALFMRLVADEKAKGGAS